MKQCTPPPLPAGPPAELIPVMAASALFPVVVFLCFAGLLVFLVVKLVQAHERHRTTALELTEIRVHAARLEAELGSLRSSSSPE
jgi:hypothetical protein